MRKILLEVIAIMFALLFAAVLVFFFTQNIGQNNYDTFTGNVSKAPLTITSPVYGQILTLPVKEGDTVTKGQTLATVEILNPNTIPAPSALYHVHGNMLSVQSPSNGVIGQIALAPLSTIAGAGTRSATPSERPPSNGSTTAPIPPLPTTGNTPPSTSSPSATRRSSWATSGRTAISIPPRWRASSASSGPAAACLCSHGRRAPGPA